jgi:hypothetical protein
MHDIHVQEHNRFRLDVTYEDFERTNPELAAMFDAHVQQHEQVMMQKTAMLAEQMNPQKEQKPAQSIPYKDVPVNAKIQMLQQAGIDATPEDIVQQIQLDIAAKQKKETPKQAS